MITLCKTLFRPHLKSSGAEYVILGEKKKKKTTRRGLITYERLLREVKM